MNTVVILENIIRTYTKKGRTGRDNRKEASGVVEVVLLLIVAVALCGLFKGQASTFLSGMFQTLTQNAGEMFG